MPEAKISDCGEGRYNTARGWGTNTVTWVVYCLLLWRRTESRPGPLALRTVVSSARMMKVFPLANVRFFASAVAWST